MADEITSVTLLGNQGDPIEVTVADAGALAKGTVMKLSSSPQTCAITGAANDIFMGITKEEKTANDGTVKIALLTHFIGDFTCGAGETMVLGAPVMTGAAPNEVDVEVTDTVEGRAHIVGIALETVGNNGVGAVLVNVGKRV